VGWDSDGPETIPLHGWEESWNYIKWDYIGSVRISLMFSKLCRYCHDVWAIFTQSTHLSRLFRAWAKKSGKSKDQVDPIIENNGIEYLPLKTFLEPHKFWIYLIFRLKP
jgi:hypothetical protein